MNVGNNADATIEPITIHGDLSTLFILSGTNKLIIINIVAIAPVEHFAPTVNSRHINAKNKKRILHV